MLNACIFFPINVIDGSKVLQLAYLSDISPSFGPWLLPLKMCFYVQLKKIIFISKVPELILIPSTA